MMKQDEELWMKKMKEVLKDYSEPPVPDGWSRLEKELPPVVEKRIHPRIWWASAAAVLLLGICGVSLLFMQTPAADEIRDTATKIVAAGPDTMPVSKDSDPSTAQIEPVSTDLITSKPGTASLIARNEKKVSGSDIVEPTDNGNVTDIIEKRTPSITEGTEQEVDKTEDTTDKTKIQDKPDNDRKIVRPSGKDKLHLPVESKKKSSSKGDWSLAASVTNAAGASTSQSADYLMMALPSADAASGLSSGMISLDGNSELVFEQGLPYLKQSIKVSEMKHKQPISFGLSVRKNLSNGFSIESGVTYTMLSSEGTSVNSAEKVEQKLHYIGIPVKGNWDFVDSKRFTVYASAGGMVEKCVYGKIGTEKQTVKPLQFSLTGGVGAQLNVSNRVGIYVEPGVSYFFDDGSDVETIRKENPFNFNLQAGIRLTY